MHEMYWHWCGANAISSLLFLNVRADGRADWTTARIAGLNPTARQMPFSPKSIPLAGCKVNIYQHSEIAVVAGPHTAVQGRGKRHIGPVALRRIDILPTLYLPMQTHRAMLSQHNRVSDFGAC